MTLGRIFGFLLVIAIVGGILHYRGDLKAPSGGVAPTANSANSNAADPYTLGEAKFMAGHYGEALGIYQQALQTQPNHAEAATARFRIGKCNEDLKRQADALAAYREFVAKHPGDNRVGRANERIEYLASQLGK